MSKRSVAADVAEAAILNREIKEKAARVDDLKERIREHALREASKRPYAEQNEKVEIESPEGVATISFPKDAVSLVEGANPRALRSEIPDATWAHLFEERVVLAKEFDAAYKLLAKAEQEQVRRLVQWVTPKPSVLLPK